MAGVAGTLRLEALVVGVALNAVKLVVVRQNGGRRCRPAVVVSLSMADFTDPIGVHSSSAISVITEAGPSTGNFLEIDRVAKNAVPNPLDISRTCRSMACTASERSAPSSIFIAKVSAVV